MHLQLTHLLPVTNTRYKYSFLKRLKQINILLFFVAEKITKFYLLKTTKKLTVQFSSDTFYVES